MAEYAESTHHSQQSLRRFAHVRRFDRALELLQVGRDHAVLDLGAGDGYFLGRVAASSPGSTLTAVEPDQQMQTRLRASLRNLIESGQLTVLHHGNDLAPRSFDRLTCLEVLEHLPPRLQREALNLMSRVARPNARLVISVPIEVGPVVVVKALARLRSGEPAEPWRYLLNAALGRPTLRPDDDYILTHTGFRFRDLEKEIASSPWSIERRVFSPLGFGNCLINSQVLYVLRQREDTERR